MHPIFIEAPFTIARIWKQPNCLSTDEWIKISDTHTHTHITYIYNGALLGHKKNEIL